MTRDKGQTEDEPASGQQVQETIQEFYESPSHCRFGPFCTLTLVSQQAAAVEYALPAANSRLIGENQEYVVPADNRPLEQIAADFQLGLTNIMEANPGSTPICRRRAAS